jgi:hypothetical protein
VSNDPNDYTRNVEVEAVDEVAAVKAAAISFTAKDSSNIEWIKNLEGNLQSVVDRLMICGYVFTRTELIS